MYLSKPQNGAFSDDYQMTGSSISCGRGVGSIFRRDDIYGDDIGRTYGSLISSSYR